MFLSIVKKLIKRHGKVKVVFSEIDDADMLRRRVLFGDGRCKVAYKSYGYKRWSGYIGSCFSYYHEDEHKRLTVNNTLHAMSQHDSGWIEPLLIEYGEKFSKKRKIK